MTAPLDSLGCLAGGLHKNQELAGAGIRLYRKRAGAAQPGAVETPPTDRGFLVGVALARGHRRRIVREGRASEHAFDRHAIYIRPFAESYRASLSGPMDFFLLELSPAFLERAGDGRRQALSWVAGREDRLLGRLATAVLPLLERPHEASPLFVDQMGLAMATHVLDHYGGTTERLPRHGRALPRQLEDRAKDMLRARLDGAITIAEVADACQLSRSYFSRAFRAGTGLTPHQWLMRQRVDMAQGLLARSALSLADIASACGFADQSHFTRVFTQAAGMPPGGWRRDRAGDAAGRQLPAAPPAGRAGC